MPAQVQGRDGRQDRSIPVEAVEEMAPGSSSRQDGAPQIHWYDAGHAFADDENPKGDHDPEAAALACGRAVDFLRAQVR